MSATNAEKRLYELADGSLVDVLVGSGSLFCTEGEELSGDRAERYRAWEESQREPEESPQEELKAAEPVEDKAVASVADKQKRPRGRRRG